MARALLAYSISPALPTGLSLDSGSGNIAGTPTVTQTQTTYTVTVTDANSATATATFQLTVNSTVTATQAIASVMLTANHLATTFTPVNGSGGTGPLAYSISPTLPTGLSISPATGAISGTPTDALTQTHFTVTVTDANGETATAPFSLSVNSTVTATQSVPSVVVNANHVTAVTPVTGSGGTGLLAYSISPTLPAGLSFSPTTGAITGTPTAAQTRTTYRVTVTDANSATADATFTLTVNGALVATQNVPTTILTLNREATAFTPVTASEVRIRSFLPSHRSSLPACPSIRRQDWSAAPPR